MEDVKVRVGEFLSALGNGVFYFLVVGMTLFSGVGTYINWHKETSWLWLLGFIAFVAVLILAAYLDAKNKALDEELLNQYRNSYRLARQRNYP